MPSVMMGLRDAKLLASALVPHASTNDITPALKNIVLGGQNGQYAYATDRYTVGRYDLTGVVDDLPEQELYIPRGLLSVIRSLGRASLVHDEHLYRLLVETLEVGKVKYIQAKIVLHDEELGDTVHWMRTWDSLAASGFPPVGRLFNDLVAGGDGTVLLGPEQVEKFTRYAMSIRERVAVTFTESSTFTVTNKLSPLLVEIGPRFKGLLQPNIMTERFGLGADILAENAAAIAKAKAEAEAGATPTSEATPEATE